MNQSPRVLGNRYEVGDLLGRGGMAEVHLGRDTRLGRVVAIKLLRTDLARDPMFQARFRREAQSAAGLNHPAIVAVYDTGEETIAESGGSTVALPYIVMEYVEGRTLRDILREGEPMEVPQALEVTSGVLSALDYSHRMGIVHRDIKPANVMLTANGDVKVMDFGIARALADVSATMTQTQAVIGTAQYLSPEQARGETVDARSDLYSAGCLLFELMTGRPPFVADSPVAVAYQHVREMPPPPSAFNPRIPEVVDRIVLHALAKDREARYQTAADFRADLESALAGRSVAASTVALAAPSVAGTQATTEYLPQSAGATQAYPQGPPGAYPQQPAFPQHGYQPGATQAYPAPPDSPYGRPAEGYPAPDAYPGDQYPPDGGYSRRGERRAAAAETSNRRLGFALLALLVVLLFAGAAYGVSYLVSNNAASNSQVSVPDVTGMTQAQALAALQAKGLVATPQLEASDTVAKGNAIRVEPSGVVARGTRVTLFVSSGAATATVPDVHGKSVSEAKALLAAKGLQVNSIVNPVDSSGLPKDTVVSTDPAAGQPASKSDKVTLNVSSGKAVVPDVKGKTKDEAVKELQSKGFTNDQILIELIPTADQQPGLVIEQSPDPSTKPVSVKTITLGVSAPAASTTSPGPSPSGSGNGDGQPTDTGNGQGNGQGNGDGNGGGNGNGQGNG